MEDFSSFLGFSFFLFDFSEFLLGALGFIALLLSLFLGSFELIGHGMGGLALNRFYIILVRFDIEGSFKLRSK